jgi:hypothetical protein
MTLPIYGPPDNGDIGGSPPPLVQDSFPVTSVNGKTGAVILSTSDFGLGNVNNTSDANKPVGTATASAIGVVQTQVTAQAGQILSLQADTLLD